LNVSLPDGTTADVWTCDRSMEAGVLTITNDLSPPARTYQSAAGVMVPVTFENDADKPCTLWWYNYQGARVNYGVLQPGASMAMNTYATHPWVCTGDGEFRMGAMGTQRPGHGAAVTAGMGAGVTGYGARQEQVFVTAETDANTIVHINGDRYADPAEDRVGGRGSDVYVDQSRLDKAWNTTVEWSYRHE
jgi:hypothetical protein